METCKHCGGEIIFRYVGGSPTPIHVSGGCSGWGNSGSAPTSLHFERDHPICFRSPCPKCGERVYFIRHNGGSMWVEELGWPWEKHPCMTSDEHAEKTFRDIRTVSTASQGKQYGAIVRFVSYAKGLKSCLVVIERLGEDRTPWIVWDVADPPSLLGAVVVVSNDGTQLSHPGFGSYRIEEAETPCATCGELIIHSKHREHMMQKHNLEVCSICKSYIVRDALQQHLAIHARDAQRAKTRNKSRYRTRN